MQFMFRDDRVVILKISKLLDIMDCIKFRMITCIGLDSIHLEYARISARLPFTHTVLPFTYEKVKIDRD